MIRKLALALTAFATTLALGGTAALAGPSHATADPGLTATSILLGTTSPLTGSASAYASVARGADAYFKYVNSKGGVHGRTITNTIVDDGYNPALTVQATRKLVEQDKVFAIFNALGTEHNDATRDYLNANKVPQLFSATGATKFGSEAAKYPYTIGFQPSYQSEGWVLGKYLARTQGAAKVGGPVPERRLRQGSPERVEAGHPALEREGRRGRAVRGHRVGRPGAGREAEGVRRDGVRDLRDAEVRDPGLRLREPARRGSRS